MLDLCWACSWWTCLLWEKEKSEMKWIIWSIGGVLWVNEQDANFGCIKNIGIECKIWLESFLLEGAVNCLYYWDWALTGALQSPSIDKRWKGTHGVLNSRVYSYLFGRELWKTNKDGGEFILFINVIICGRELDLFIKVIFLLLWSLLKCDLLWPA